MIPRALRQQLYVDVDKDLKQIRTEAIARRLYKIFHELHPDLDLFCRKWDGQICFRWISLVRVIFVTASKYKLEWNLDLAVAKIDRVAADAVS